MDKLSPYTHPTHNGEKAKDNPSKLQKQNTGSAQQSTASLSRPVWLPAPHSWASRGSLIRTQFSSTGMVHWCLSAALGSILWNILPFSIRNGLYLLLNNFCGLVIVKAQASRGLFSFEWSLSLFGHTSALASAGMHAKLLQLCPTLCDTVDHSLPGSVHRFSRQEYWIGLPCPPPGDLPNPPFLVLPALTGRFFATSAT